MTYPKSLIIALALLSFSVCLTAQNQAKSQKVDVASPNFNYQKMTAEVKDAYLHAWNGYKQYAWGMDALLPLSKSGHNWYPQSLLMTPIDAYDGLLIMGFKDEAVEAKKLIFEKLSFNVDMEVQNFEVSIRILGGLLSAYELDGDKRFLNLAEDLANRLIKSFDSPTGMPYRYVNLKTGKTRGEISNPAEIGTYIVEYGVLSRDLNNPKYYETAKKAMSALYAKRSSLDLTGSSINVETGEWVSTSSHISGGIDSYLEYMLKAGILFKDDDMSKMWQSSLKAVNSHLLDKRYTGSWYGRADMKDGILKNSYYGALDAFFAGSLAMAGDLDNAAALQQSNYNMWMLTGIEPEVLDYSTMTVVSPGYELRPENLEGAYYLYHYTGNVKYLEMGKAMFDNLVKYCKNEVGFCALSDVRTFEKKDEMESFFLAETLKYAFLLFDNGASLDFNKVIFNTEAHPYVREFRK